LFAAPRPERIHGGPRLKDQFGRVFAPAEQPPHDRLICIGRTASVSPGLVELLPQLFR
jgi:hypothetical protein